MHLGKPVSWVEDRRESLVASTNCREHHYEITGYADEKGRLLAIECEATVMGRLFNLSFSACLEAAQIASILRDPMTFRALSAGPGALRLTNPRSCRTEVWQEQGLFRVGDTFG